MVYNHFDSYFSYLGRDLLNELRKMIKEDKFDEWLELFKKLRMVAENDDATEEDIAKCQAYHDENVGDGHNWYSLLRKCQGSFEKVLQSGFMCRQPQDKDNAISLDLFIEYIYVLDFDAKSFIIHYTNKDGTKVEEFDLYHLPCRLHLNKEHEYDVEAPVLK